MTRAARGAAPARARFYKLCSLLLQYPSPDVLDARTDVAGVGYALPESPARRALEPFLGYWMSAPAAALLQHYVATFDLQKRSTLYLTYYLYGDRRQRGMAFVRLRQLYAAAGWTPATRELPDYLPLMLEFAAAAPAEAGAAVLAECRPGLELLHRGLVEAGSPYAAAVEALRLTLSPLDRRTRELVTRLAVEGPPTESVGLEPLVSPGAMQPRSAGASAPPCTAGDRVAPGGGGPVDAREPRP